MAVTKKPTLAEQLRDIENAAPGLRRAGVTRIAIGEVRADFAPTAPTPPAERRGDIDDAPPDLEMGSLDAWRGGRKPGSVS